MGVVQLGIATKCSKLPSDARAGDILSYNEPGFWRESSHSRLPHRFCLLQPIHHLHLAEHRQRDRQVPLRLLAPADPDIECSEAQVAAGRVRAQAEFLTSDQRLSEMSFGPDDVGVIATSFHLAEKPERPGLAALLSGCLRETERSFGDGARCTDSISQQICLAKTQDPSGGGALSSPRLFLFGALVKGDRRCETTLVRVGEGKTRGDGG